jgi:hypothetical protein
MSMTSINLRPGVNTMQTLSQNEAGVSASNLVRYQQSMIQKYGGWTQYYPIAIGSTIKELWGWEGLTTNKYLAIGATQSLSVIVQGSNQNITPQTATTNDAVNVSISSGSNIVTFIDNGSSATTLTTIYLNTPIAIGNLLLNGAYPVNSVGSVNTYSILSSVAASTTITSSGVVPFFSVSSGSATVTVTLPNNNFPTTLGLYQQFIAPTALGGVTIQGPYQIRSVIDSTSFTINTVNQGSSAATGYQNGGNAQIVYYYTLGPPAALGYGAGGYGLGGYGTGVTAPAGSGAPITATDWSLANWGETLLSCPSGGPLYAWSANAGFQNAQVVATAPFFNGGIFVSQPQQILVLWASDQTTGVQDPLLVRWSDALDYTNYNVTSQTWAGSFRIPTGSVIKGGIQSAQQGIIWTDIDCYVMQNVGQPIVFGFNRVGSGCGLVGQHACGVLNGNVYWMSFNNFFVLDSNGVQILPCPVWNFVFQNIDTMNFANVRCAINSLFNEVAWFFPALNGTGQNTLYAKFNISENEWDYGMLGRSAWIDVTVLGNPIAADLAGILWQHEIGYNAGTVAIDSSFQTGYWSITEGNDMAFVDWILPDMTFSPYGSGTSANLAITFFATDYTGDTPRTYGPYNFNGATEFINTRIRGRFLSMKIEGDDLGSFWRIGRLRYRYAVDGRR